jgi:hypothetical protein
MFDLTHVYIALSNQCNLAHAKCPVSVYKERFLLPTPVIHKVLNELAKEGFRGEVCWHRYNEPFIDSRLPDLIDYTWSLMPHVHIRILTNGTIPHEWADKRGVEVQHSDNYDKMDGRLGLYDQPVVCLKKPCHGMHELQITCEGKVGLCCLDWKDMQTFGDVATENLSDILASDKYIKARQELDAGVRSFEPCTRCTWTRGLW